MTDVPGVGDDAYLNGPDLLFVRVGNRGFSVRIYTDAGTDANRVRVHRGDGETRSAGCISQAGVARTTHGVKGGKCTCVTPGLSRQLRP